MHGRMDHHLRKSRKSSPGEVVLDEKLTQNTEK